MVVVWALICTLGIIGISMLVVYAQDGEVIVRAFWKMWVLVFLVVYIVFLGYFLIVLN